MNYTFRNNIWKGEATNSIIPTNSRPFSNNDNNLNNIKRTPFKANPIKHWRKQLYPYYETKSSKQVSIDMIEAPTTSVYVKNTFDCDDNIQLLKENITMLNKCNGIKISNEEHTRCIGGTHNVKRSGSTNIKKNYYSNYSKYLNARCKSYEKNNTLGTKIDDTTFNPSRVCSMGTNKDCSYSITYNPSNKVFLEQGAVSSSTNTLRKKNIEIEKNSNSLVNEYGIGISKNSLYNTNTGYNIQFKKEKNNTKCKKYRQKSTIC